MPSKPGLQKKLSGNVGLLFTNASRSELDTTLAKHSATTYARSGAISTSAFSLPAGPLVKDGLPMPNSMEVMLRKLGLKTELKVGVLVLREATVICAARQRLTSDMCVLLKLFGIEMATFEIELLSSLANGVYEEIIATEADDEVVEAEMDGDDDEVVLK